MLNPPSRRAVLFRLLLKTHIRSLPGYNLYYNTQGQYEMVNVTCQVMALPTILGVEMAKSYDSPDCLLRYLHPRYYVNVRVHCTRQDR